MTCQVSGSSSARKAVISGTVLLLLLITAVQAASAGQDNSVLKSPDGKGYRFDVNGWVYLHTEGAPYERGYQHGYLLAPEIRQELDATRYLTFQETGMPWEFFVNQSVQMFADRIDPEYREEIRGIAEGATAAGTPVSWQEVLALNAEMEVVDYWWPTVQDDEYEKINDHEHCSAFIATGSWTNGGKIVVAHNTWSAFEDERFCNLIHDIQPEKGNRILMQSLPGHIDSNADYLVTSGGLMITETSIGGFSQYKTDASPEFFRARKAAQYAGDLDTFVAIMQLNSSGGYANSWLVGDAKTGEIMRFEQGLKFFSVNKTRDGYFIGANYVEDPRIRNLETTGLSGTDIRDSVAARRVRFNDLMAQNKGQITTDRAKEILSDHYDVWLEREQPSCRTVEGRCDLDPRPQGSPFRPSGATDGKVMDSAMAANMTLTARWGSSSGLPFDAAVFVKQHPQYQYLDGYLPSFPTQPWTTFTAGDLPGQQEIDTTTHLPVRLMRLPVVSEPL
ncbi:MAG: hypothetical protein GYA23_11210 [Methanomicrobiales archaeon]|nr:hypothetical protein [Methanomicrobiales archaeon]